MKKKNKVILIVIIFLLIIIITIVSYFGCKWYNFSYKKNIIIEVGDDIPIGNDYLNIDESDKIKIIWFNLDNIDGKTYKEGIYKGKFKYRNKEVEIELTVKDTTKPVINGIKDIEMTAYEKVPDLLEGISVTDNSQEDIKVKLEGKYDSEKVGEYPLYYLAVDSAGNETKEGFKLIVKENKNIKLSMSNKGYQIKNYYGITYVDDIMVVNKTYSLPSNFVPKNLKPINSYLQIVDYVKDAFDEMKRDSANLGLKIYASSAYRSYQTQKYIYNNYLKADGKELADTYSARAGHSEHQTGLVIDLNTINESFGKTKESDWLKENCYKYGFIIRYPKGKEDITGYMYEPWHIRYVGKDFAKTLYNDGDWLTIEEYFGLESKYQ